eukprot:XP_024462109.1 sucrose transport protein SUC3 isoform X2 [Populus trichocarpa]
MESAPIRVPYRNLKKEIEVEMVGLEMESPPSPHRIQSPHTHNSDADLRSQSTRHHISLITLVLSCTVAAGVQFGWALQLSLLTPYIQTLGIGHAFSSFIWLCGPITGLVVQPCVGIWSDKCSSKFGRRRPFILAGSLMISVAVIIIGFSADIGYVLGDTEEHCSKFKGTRTWAAFVFVIGFWMLDLANNTVQGPARALLADLSGPDQHNLSNAVFCSWMAVGNILGFSAGASGSWNRWFPFLMNRACCEACGNLKAAFLVAVVFLTFCTLVTLYFADEVPLNVNQPRHLSDSAPLLNGSQQNGHELSTSESHLPGLDNLSGNGNNHDHELRMNSKHANSVGDQNENFSDGPGAVLVNLLTSLRHLPPGMHSVLVVMALTWIGWEEKFITEIQKGIRMKWSCMIKESEKVVLGISSFLIEPMCRRLGSRFVWAMSNFIVFVCMAGTAVISLISVGEYSEGIEHVIGGNAPIRIAALIVFALLGFPLAITYSVPFSVTAELTADSGGGQGLAIGVLNLAIVIPQMIISIGAGPWDALFGGGNIPAFVLASVSALAAGVIATLKLPNLSSRSFQSGFHFG